MDSLIPGQHMSQMAPQVVQDLGRDTDRNLGQAGAGNVETRIILGLAAPTLALFAYGARSQVTCYRSVIPAHQKRNKGQ